MASTQSSADWPREPTLSPWEAKRRLIVGGGATSVEHEGFVYVLTGASQSSKKLLAPIAEDGDGNVWYCSGETDVPIDQTTIWKMG